MSASRRISSVDARLLARIERAFEGLADASARLDAERMQRALGLRSAYLAGRILTTFDADGDGSVTRDEFVHGVRSLLEGTDEDRLHFAFRLHDHDGDGYLGPQDLYRMIALSLAEADVRAEGSVAPDRLAAVVVGDADRNRDGRVSFREFCAAVQRRPAILRALVRSEALWIAPNEDLLARIDRPDAIERGARLARYLQNRALPALYLGAYVLANLVVAALCARGTVPLRGAPDPWMLAGRASGAVLALNAALVLVPVLRRFGTWLRGTRAGRVVPVDQALDLHRLVGHVLFGAAVVHALAFGVSRLTGHAAALVTYLTATRRGATGLALLAVFGVLWALALPAVRRSRRFELFYASHLLFVPWFVLLVLHAKSVVPWVALPAALYLVEVASKARRQAFSSVLVRAQALRSGVTRLDFQRPPGFTYEPGDYVFLRVPAVARHEWHPFTLSSAPEHEALTVHVRSLGNWTAALRRRVEDDELRDASEPLRLHLDGPYGSPTAHLFRAKYAVLIGAGIGVTPFASVLESLRVRALDGREGTLRKAHFVWLNRDQYAFEWFADLLAELEATAPPGLFDLQLFMTGGRSGAADVGLELARAAASEAGHPDVVTGLRTRTTFGRPDWDAVLGAIAREHAPDTVEVFFCGPPGLAAAIEPVCARLGMPFREEKF